MVLVAFFFLYHLFEVKSWKLILLIYKLFSSYCSCGNVINHPKSNLSDINCNVPCFGNPLLDFKCGGGAIISIFEVFNSSSTSPKANTHNARTSNLRKISSNPS